ncbi:MAG: alpha/beta hydrolase fold domain-containing protein [Trebonia sp.]
MSTHRLTCHPGIEYANVAGFRPLELDLYLPGPEARIADPPVVVHVHGGGWRRGSRRHPLPAVSGGFYAELAGHGIVVAAIDYRLSGEARYPAAVDDVRAAVTWVRASLGKYGIGHGPVALWGDSAGGHLALQAALTGTAVEGVVAWFPVTDLTSTGGEADEDPGSREALFLGAPPSRVPELAWDASPIAHVHAGAPPMLVMHGDADTMVPTDQSIRFARAVREAGGQAELVLVPGAAHFWDGAADVPAIVARSTDFVCSLSRTTPAFPLS